MTFSINIDTTLESNKLDLFSLSDMNNVLINLPDNEEKLISPNIIRDSLLTIWSSIGLKFTKSSNGYDYIGLDSGNPIERNISGDKLLIGKRSFSGTNSYIDGHDIMKDSLLNSDVDLFFYNTKRDSLFQNTTRVVFLSGSNPSSFLRAPYMQSQLIGNPSSISFDIINPTILSGNINITSDFGTVSINNVVFPTIASNSNTTINDGILKYSSLSKSMYWEQLSFDTDDIGNPLDELNIYGDTSVNGYPLYFSDNRHISMTFSDISVGTTFNNEGIVEVLRRMLYEYLEPTCGIRILPPFELGYVEIASKPMIQLEYTIVKRSKPTIRTILKNMIPSFHEPIVTNLHSTVIETAQGVVIPNPIGTASSVFTITVSDNIKTNSASVSVTGIYPYFMGRTKKSPSTHSYPLLLLDLNKKIEVLGNKEHYFDETFGYDYFIYNDEYPELVKIEKEDGTDVTNLFYYTTEVISSANSRWNPKRFKIYKSLIENTEPIRYKFIYY
jgi:hypothetical protein